MTKNKYTAAFIAIVMLTVVSDLLADLLAIHMFAVGSFRFTGGEFIFPIVYIVNDIVTEVYGIKTTKKIIWCGLIANAYALGAITIVAYLAGAGTPIYDYIIGGYGVASAIAVAIAGFGAYLVASFVNAHIMDKMKQRDQEKRFALRAFVSTVFGELCDSAVFGGIACLLGLYAWSDYMSLTFTVLWLKVLIEAVCLPLTSVIVRKIKVLEMR